MRLIMKKWSVIFCLLLFAACFSGCSGKQAEQEQKEVKVSEGNKENAENTPFGRYEETVIYTLGKMTGRNHSNLPAGDSYENNAYTRYLKKKLNIQNVDAFEAVEGEDFTEAVSMTIASKRLPDVMVINDSETLQLLVDKDMIEDLTSVYETCTSARIKEIYQSYGDEILENVTFDGKLMALPETNIANGASLLWLRRDWLDRLGLKAPETIDDVEKIVKEFIKKNPGGNEKGKTLGLACDDELTGECDYSYEYQMDIVFAHYDAYPKQWLRNEKGEVVYGSVQRQAKEALKRVRRMYQDGVIDKSFLLRSSNNIVDEIVSGRCGAFFGPWWAPNNPLMAAMKADMYADWTPYLIQTDADGSTSFAAQKPSTKWVVVRKGYEHPEIVMKIVSVLFDEMKYGDVETEELARYYQENVDPTARPLAINVDYNDALFRCYDELQAALTGKKEVSELGMLEGSYYESCYRYQRERSDASLEDWAAYTSRVTACLTLTEGKVNTVQTLHYGDTPTMKLKWWKLKKLEKEAYLEIVMGEKPLDYFDEFVQKWYEQGGKEITQEMEVLDRQAKKR